MDLHIIEFQVIEIGILILAAYLGGLLARKIKIGEVIGQIAGGILVGPHFLVLCKDLLQNSAFLQTTYLLAPLGNFVNDFYPRYTQVFQNASFFTFIYLGLITFALGEELHIQRIKQIGKHAAVITIAQAILTLLFIVIGFWQILHFPLILSLIMGSIGIATAPALSFIIMNRLKIEGSMRNLLANIIVVDDLIEVVLFSIFLGVAVYMSQTGNVFHSIILLESLKELSVTILIGIVMFLILLFLIRVRRNVRRNDSEENEHFLYAVMSNHPTPSVEIMFIIIGVISIGIGICMHNQLPFMLATITTGFLIANFHSQAVFDSLKLKNVMPLFNLFFFALIGASIRIELISVRTLQFALVYIVLRTLGKFGGTWLACKYTKLDPKITATLPRLMLPQAELAAIEVLLVANLLPKTVYVEDMVNTIIVSLLVFQVGGAWLSEKTLIRWKHWIAGELDAMKSVSKNMEFSVFKKLLMNRIIEINPSDRNSAITILSEYLVKKAIVTEAAQVNDAVLEREALMSTAIGNGIAIPHCRLQTVSEVIVVCAILRNPIDWESPDKNPVDIVFLILTPIDSPELYLSSLSAISTTLRTTNFHADIKIAYKSNRVEEYLNKLK